MITAPFFYYLHEEPYDFFRPTVHALSHFAGRNGFKVIEMRKLGDAWDILGTVAAGCRFRAVDGSWVNRGLAWGLWKVRDFVFRRIAAGGIRKRVAFGGAMYLSNLAVLERVGGGEDAGTRR